MQKVQHEADKKINQKLENEKQTSFECQLIQLMKPVKPIEPTKDYITILKYRK